MGIIIGWVCKCKRSDTHLLRSDSGVNHCDAAQLRHRLNLQHACRWGKRRALGVSIKFCGGSGSAAAPSICSALRHSSSAALATHMSHVYHG